MPKITRSRGPSWETDPPAVPEQRDGEQVSNDEMNESSVNGKLGGLEEVQHVEPLDNYEDKEEWPYASLQAASRARWADAPVNGVSREDLIKRLREDDEAKRQAGNDDTNNAD